MLRRVIFLWLLLLLPASLQGAPGVETDCFAETAPVPWRSCISKVEGSKNKDIVYYLHGKGGDETNWHKGDYFSRLIYERWESEGVDAPTVVTVSFGPVWVLAPKNPSPVSGLYEVFFGAVVPKIEAQLAQGGRRILAGGSMGGFNVAQLALKAGDKFDKAAILCPPLIRMSPFASEEDIQNYITRHKADPARVLEMVQLGRAFYPTAADWDGAAPHNLIATAKDLPELYVSCGLADEYGFFDDVEEFVRKARKRNAKIHWRPLAGDHCTADIVSLADFLVE